MGALAKGSRVSLPVLFVLRLRLGGLVLGSFTVVLDFVEDFLLGVGALHLFLLLGLLGHWGFRGMAVQSSGFDYNSDKRGQGNERVYIRRLCEFILGLQCK